MNELSKIRTYINNQVKKVSSDFKEHKDAFNDENIAGTRFNKAFHVSYDAPSIIEVELTAEMDMSVTLQLFFKGGRDTISTYDDAMDTMWNVLREVASRRNLNDFRATDNYPIQSASPNSIVVEPLENNDNSMVVTLNLTMKVITTIC
jgi:hypothetical protein